MKNRNLTIMTTLILSVGVLSKGQSMECNYSNGGEKEISSSQSTVGDNVQNTNSSESIDTLLGRFDHLEEIPLGEFTQSIQYDINKILSIEQITEKIEHIGHFTRNILSDATERPRFLDINSPYFIAFESALSPFVENDQISPPIRSRLALLLSCSYALILPRSGLPIDDPYMHGNLKWRNYIIDRYDEIGVHDPHLYVDSCVYVSGIYERRAEKTFSDIPLDPNNPYVRISGSYMKKALFASKNVKDLSYREEYAVLEKYALMLEKYLPKNGTLQDECVKEAIEALEQCVTFASNPPNKKMSLYIYSSTALKELELVANRHAYTTAQLDQLEKEYEDDMRENGFLMWDREERCNAERDADKARAKLGWLYYRLPQGDNQKPDYDKARYWFLSCRDKGYNKVRKGLALLESAIPGKI